MSKQESRVDPGSEVSLRDALNVAEVEFRDEAPAATSAQATAEPQEFNRLRPLGARAAFRQELVRLGLHIGVGLLCGATFGWLGGALTIALLIYIAQQLRQLWFLRRWVDSPSSYELPEAVGIWGDIFAKNEELQRRSRKRKRKLAAIVAEFQASTAALPDGAVVLGKSGDIVWFNRAAQRLLGLRNGQDLGLRIANLIRHPSFASYLSRQSYEGEIEVPSPLNMAVTLSLRVIPYGNEQRLLIVRDISEIRRLETARRDFVANASHELRTPLTVLSGYLDMMDPESQQPRSGLAPWRMPIREMRNQAARMESLIRDMLKLARLESESSDASRQELIQIPTLLERLIRDLRSVSAVSHRFETAIQADLLLYGRETEVQSILGNLIGNAIRYTPADGVIRVRWYAAVDGAHFEVADTGIGIAAEDLPRLTERFYRVDVGRSRASGGTGLGLSIVRHALERHDSALRIESELGVGSTFSCVFPPHRLQLAVSDADTGSSPPVMR